MPSDTVEFECKRITHTAASIKVACKVGSRWETVWFPRSVIVSGGAKLQSAPFGTPVTLRVQRWCAENKGLV